MWYHLNKQKKNEETSLNCLMEQKRVKIDAGNHSNV